MKALDNRLQWKTLEGYILVCVFHYISGSLGTLDVLSCKKKFCKKKHFEGLEFLQVPKIMNFVIKKDH